MRDRVVRRRAALAERGRPARRPRAVYAAWTSAPGSPGHVTDSDLRGLLPDVWMRIDRPEQVIGAAAWVEMFRAAGFLSQPTNIRAPAKPLTLYRGAAHERRTGMAWSLDAKTADQFRRRCEQFGETAFLFSVHVPPAAVLALFGSRAEQEAVIDPAVLSGVRRRS